MNEESLKKVLIVLVDVKASMHDAANTGAIEQLDEAIELIQECIETSIMTWAHSSLCCLR